MNPGSKEAVSAGCICPEMENRRGAGAYLRSDETIAFWVNQDCPLHGEMEDVHPDTLLCDCGQCAGKMEARNG